MSMACEKSALVGRRWLCVMLLLGVSAAHAAGVDALYATTLTGLDGKPVALAGYKGKPMIVNFWARWCGPCRVEIPELQKAHARYRGQGLVVLGIALEDQPEAVRDFMKAYDMEYPVVLANSGGESKGIWLMQTLGNSRAGLPFTMVIDRQGEIVSRKLGVMKAADIDAAISAVLR